MPRRPQVFGRQRSATLAAPETPTEAAEDDDVDYVDPQEVLGQPETASPSHSPTRDVLSKSLSSSQTRRLQKSPDSNNNNNNGKKHKRHSSYDFANMLSLDDDSATDTRSPPGPDSDSASAAASAPANSGLSRLKRVSSRIWGNNNNNNNNNHAHGPHSAPASRLSQQAPGTDSFANDDSLAVVPPGSPSTSNIRRTLNRKHGQSIIQSSNAAVAQEFFPKRFGSSWFSSASSANESTASLHPSSAETTTSSDAPPGTPQSSSSFSHKLASPLRAMSPRHSNSRQQPATPASSTSGTNADTGNRLFDRRWMDKAANYLFDTDSNVDKATEDIWLLGVCHPGYRAEQPEPVSSTSSLPPARSGSPVKSIASATKKVRRRHTNALAPTASTSSSSSAYSEGGTHTPPTPTASQSPAVGVSALPTLAQTAGWPPSFYLDFTSRMQLTYRSGFPPIVVPGQETQESSTSAPNGNGSFRDFVGSIASSIGRKDGLTTDAGWGCMLRTGQSLLANALSKHHLGRDWRKPIPQQTTADSNASLPGGSQTLYPPDYARYSRMVTWFLDDPAPTSPFSVHRFALVGKQLGKEVGQWFGPSTAAFAIKELCQDFPAAQMGVAAAVDATVYVPEILAASESWSKPVLILLNLRLGLNGINPIYYPAMKSLFTFPQSVGIAGGRPGSSYYFVGSQADSLFYIDPHYSKPAVPLPRMRPDGSLLDQALQQPLSPRPDAFKVDEEWQKVHAEPSAARRTPTVEVISDESVASEEDSWVEASQEQVDRPRPSLSKVSAPSASSASSSGASPSMFASGVSAHSNGSTGNFKPASTSKPSPLDDFYASAYSPTELSSFHPERVRKMAISGLDPSMLVGFLVRSQAELDDWLERSSKLKPAVYSIQHSVPGWAKRGPNTGSRSASQATQVSPAAMSQQEPVMPAAAGPSQLNEPESDEGRSDSWDISDSEEEEGPLARSQDSSGGTTSSRYEPSIPPKQQLAGARRAAGRRANEEEDGFAAPETEELDRSAGTIAAEARST